ncbi:MAG: NUDIX domain-containing protein [Bacteroidales bacterium]|nr:NUDIX domain-containing protein [Bacteroidales bacterium]
MKNEKKIHLTADQEEMLPITDKEGNIIGKALRSECHKNKNLIHPVIHVHIYNNKGEIYLQKRSLNKKIQPGKWDTSVGGHITYGETENEALIREAWEEAGIKNGKFEKITKYLWEGKIENEIINVYKCKYENPEIISVDEIDDGKFWTKNEIEQNIGKQIFTPNFESEYLKIKDLI